MSPAKPISVTRGNSSAVPTAVVVRTGWRGGKRFSSASTDGLVVAGTGVKLAARGNRPVSFTGVRNPASARSVRSQLGHGTAHRIGDKVEWLYPIWELWTWSGSPEQPRDRAHDVEVCAPVAGDEGRPGAVDLWLIHLIYEVIAAESTCVKCGASLGRRLRLVPPFVDSPLLDWRVLVVTRCEGWRRHRHVANVVEGSKSLLFGRLSPD